MSVALEAKLMARQYGKAPVDDGALVAPRASLQASLGGRRPAGCEIG